MSTIIGIDNGVSGAVAVLRDANTAVHPTPTYVIASRTRKRTKYDVHAMGHILRGLVVESGANGIHAFVEAARVSPKFPAFPAGVLMEGFGLWRGMLAVLDIRYEEVEPKHWQGTMLAGMPKGDTKSASILVAKRLFPKVSLKRSKGCRKDDHNIADALLIAEYGRRLVTGLRI